MPWKPCLFISCFRFAKSSNHVTTTILVWQMPHKFLASILVLIYYNICQCHYNEGGVKTDDHVYSTLRQVVIVLSLFLVSFSLKLSCKSLPIVSILKSYRCNTIPTIMDIHDLTYINFSCVTQNISFFPL